MTEGALVLEGGSLRGLFTAGVLDVFMERGIQFSYVNGVSAGSMNALSYISNQPGRTMKVDLDYVHDKRFMSVGNLIKKREIFSFEFLFGEVSEKLVPFDYEAFHASPQEFEAVVTRCRTGKPEYYSNRTCRDIFTAVQASSSIPILSHMITVEGKKYLDGGVSMPIAYQRAFDKGFDKAVVVLTRHKGFRKKPADRWSNKAYHRYFAPLPELLEAIEAIPERYNRMQEEMDQLEAAGKLFIIRPDQPVAVSRFERDKMKLQELYGDGRRVAENQLPALCAYLGIPVPEVIPEVVEQENRLIGKI
ncbi:MAG: patatin family protein [Lachnospiraceae bacterium]|nr:patatin family protein [Lachnospiraceae bacterium]